MPSTVFCVTLALHVPVSSIGRKCILWVGVRVRLGPDYQYILLAYRFLLVLETV